MRPTDPAAADGDERPADLVTAEVTAVELRMLRRIRQLRRQGDAAVLLLLAPLTLCVIGDEEIIERLPASGKANHGA